jgi:AcrR family transcriptional regulator
MSARERLLAATLAHVAEHGVADLSLRTLAAAIGTSHRMLIYHFGSKEGLLVAVVQAMEERQRQILSGLDRQGLPPAEQAREIWRRLTDPAMAPYERLFFELYGQALQGRAHTTALLDGIVEDMVRPLARMLVDHGFPPDAAATRARLGVAVVRGLLLDLLATGDRAGVDAAMEMFIAAYENAPAAGPPTGAPGRATTFPAENRRP